MRLLKACLCFACLMLPVLACAQQTHAGSAAATRIDHIMQDRNSAGEFNGTVLVARRGEVIYARGFGLANREWSVPNDLQTKFEIGSMTKQFTAMLILQFVNDGKVRLDGHVSEYLPYYRPDTGKRITISELLSHTSGVPDFTEVSGFLDGPASRVRYSVREFGQSIAAATCSLSREPSSRTAIPAISCWEQFSKKFQARRTRSCSKVAFSSHWE